jgi:membrane associated rhomboid family serine protease
MVFPIGDDNTGRVRNPYITYVLIALNVLVFVFLQGVGTNERFTYAFSTVPQEIRTGEDVAREVPIEIGNERGTIPLQPTPGSVYFTLLVSMFMHGSLMHLLGNMLFLWIFGDNVEDALGSARYAAFYVLSGIAAAGAQILIDPGSMIPMVGASGAISGVLAAYASLYPRSPITVLNPIFLLWFIFGLFLELPAWLVILEYFVVNLLNGLGSIGMRSGGVAFFAHLGGFVAGLFLVRLFMVGRSAREHERWQHFRAAPRRPAARRDAPWGAPRRRDPWGW